MNVSRTWRPMPDPRDSAALGSDLCPIQAPFESLWHLAPHVASRHEPWDRWLGAETVQRIRGLVRKAEPELHPPSAVGPEEEASFQELSVRLEDQAEWCLKAPLVVRITTRKPNQPPERAVEKWIMVLPVGAVMVVVVRGHAQVYLATCYFKSERLSPDEPATRCRRLQDLYLGRHSLPSPEGFLPRPPDLDQDIKDDEAGTRERTRLIAFVTLTHWGFRAHPPHAMVRPRINYAYPPEAVPGQAERRAPPGRERRRFKPKPPRPWGEDESGEITS